MENFRRISKQCKIITHTVIHKSSVFVSHYKLLSYVCVFMAGKAQTNPASVLWSIKLWLILPVMWKQRVYKMPSHNWGMIWFGCLRKWKTACLFTWRRLFALLFLFFNIWCWISVSQKQGCGAGWSLYTCDCGPLTGHVLDYFLGSFQRSSPGTSVVLWTMFLHSPEFSFWSSTRHLEAQQ